MITLYPETLISTFINLHIYIYAHPSRFYTSSLFLQPPLFSSPEGNLWIFLCRSIHEHLQETSCYHHLKPKLRLTENTFSTPFFWTGSHCIIQASFKLTDNWLCLPSRGWDSEHGTQSQAAFNFKCYIFIHCL